MSLAEEFNAYRSRMNDRIMKTESKVFKRIWSLDTLTYQEGALDGKTKELLGLVASMVLRCDDCVKYHIEAAKNAGATHAELIETFEIATVVGGTIVIPHLRRAVEFLEDIFGKQPS